ncbi:hypothetical protein RvY_04350 [Ramazzottius varieornatus]|uniref:Uncharacterized protein n=1 Tax=Ramazzottius varieornatus TaxID=947166 RepID=A0A1D1URC3_RAMVA|nr:hypothetical protein RvY_04350 [Ramazzottius varieornatus]
MGNGTAQLDLLLVIVLVATDMYYYPAIELAIMQSDFRSSFEHDGRRLSMQVVPINRALTEQPVADNLARDYYRKVPASTTVIFLSNSKIANIV